MRILTGIKPTGIYHLGNFFGAIRPAIELQNKGEAYYFIANYHALTTTPAAKDLQELTERAALDFLACGLDPHKAVFFKQSDVPEVTELCWILSNVTPKALLERGHAVKDAEDHGKIVNHGLFSYPVLMAADILLYQSDRVPVGRDQKQHIEISRDIAIKFNSTYGDVFRIPEPDIRDEVAVIPGVDGQKMSKSYDNIIPLFADEKTIRKRIMSIVTDSTPVEAAKDPDKCNVFALYKHFSSPPEVSEMAARYRAGGMGYGEAKKALADKVWNYFASQRDVRSKLEKNSGLIHEILREGAEKARNVARKTMKEVRKAVGIDY